MDEKYFVYFDDTDFLYRVLKDNRHKLLYNPSATLYHKVGSLSKSFMKKQNNKLYRSDFLVGNFYHFDKAAYGMKIKEIGI